jgi:ABC-type Zn uptake system ZnuABC Zn-binding protein ZnuA
MRFSHKLIAAASSTIVAMTTLAGCSALPDSNDNGLLNVVATTTQVGDFAREVGGERIHLTTLLSPGASAHAFEPTQADMVALAQADVLVINGLYLESFVDDAVATSGFTGSIVDASVGLHLDTDSAGSAATAATDADHEHEGEHEGEHGSVNPHIWTSPMMAAEMVDTIAAGLSQAAPQQKTAFAKNAATYDAKLALLDSWIAQNIAQVPESERLFVSGHNSLAYYLDQYGIQFVGSLLPSFEDNAEPSVGEITKLIDAINTLGVKAIFVESSMNPKIAERIAEQTDAVLIEHDVLYADSLGAAGSGAETYLAATIHNTKTIVTAWGYPPLPLPNDLESA